MTNHKSSSKFTRFVPAIVALVVLAVIGLVISYTKKPSVTVNTTNTPTDTASVTITTSDDVNLSATVKYPVRNIQVPAIIFVHEYAKDRHQWDVHTQKFIDAGYAVLSYDMRGFGESRLPSIPTDTESHLAMLQKDVPDVIAYMKQQPSIDSEKIIVIGAGIGANIAYVASGSDLNIFRTVVLSPVPLTSVRDGSSIKNFAPKDILGVAGTADMKNLNAMMKHVTGLHEIFEVDGGSNGVSLLSNEQTLNYILTWLQS